MMNIIKEAKKAFNRDILEHQFIECLKKKGYYNNIETIEEVFLRCLVSKGYLEVSKYNCIINEMISGKSIENKSTLPKDVQRVQFKECVDTYEIDDERFIDYESVQIEGLEYYFNKGNLKIAENVNFSDIGVWDSHDQKITFDKKEDRLYHIKRVESLGSTSLY